jgi:catecholate siderophore receptor
MKKHAPPQPLSLAAAMLMALSNTAIADDTAKQTDPTATLPEVKVRDARERPNSPNTGYQAGVIRSTKTKQLAKDIPQAITTVTEQLMLDSNSDTMKSALRHVAGLTFNSGEGGRIGDNIMLRGFYSFGDLYLDGIRDVAQYNREVFHVEQIDILRGSAAMLFGRGQAGGVINRVSKEPGLVDHTEVSATVGSYSYGRLTADVNKVLGENMALRISAMKTDAESSRRGVETDREGLAPTLRWGIGTANEFSIGHLYLSTDDVPDFGVPFVATPGAVTATGVKRRPLDVPASRFYGTPSDYEKNDTNITTGSWTHRFSQDTELRTVARFADYKRALWATQPTLAGVNTTTVNDSSVIGRRQHARGGHERTATLQSDLTTKLDAAGMKHEVLVGAELLKEKADRWSYTALTDPERNALATTVGNANADPVLPAGYGNRTRNNPASYDGDSIGIYAQDQIEFIPQWKLLLGIRHDRMDADYTRQAGGITTETTLKFNEWSYRSGLLYQPDDQSSYYLAWSDSFNPTADLYQLNNGVEYDAERSRTIELGTKWELLDGALSLRTALYRATKFNERNTDLEQPNISVLSKERHTDGFEIEAAGRLTSRWDVFAGVALMRSRIDDVFVGVNNPNMVGQRPRNTPPYTANLWTTYRVGESWRVGGGIEAKGKRLAYGTGGTNPISMARVPDFIRADLMLAYEQPRYSVKLNVLNVFNKRYYESVYENGGFTVPGTERAFQLTTTLKF